ncbi:hypothetical protein KsCSTR_22930 [Candidatus Kuenenia stuttgartiensis]|uniref:Uncharacterized protein n=1 Tax=Kuenenia stuttgartiensis TaxID=174633 RepID=A0A2C9CAB1_KUEST|nr:MULTISPECIES: hypothetical protein [Kuenenia]MBZ0191940.1 hypothetical protein [Candidatus Kuenenia stuttgartiensis]MCL4726231.1 hypothetical protein [Candidatus Kuenenia stuttgartiensis]MCZ7623134.1 hypothetical protein [Candidatus Kuenenia sp.]QII11672.1 hypothetical protein KsCSTR_22930 [Candidatus Kuenenia stuttgartiensis]SOH02636.1 hypothetical protein KSMBR1_0116 [Candidatus Kuenenia stuttgartiensis]
MKIYYKNFFCPSFLSVSGHLGGKLSQSYKLLIALTINNNFNNIIP